LLLMAEGLLKQKRHGYMKGFVGKDLIRLM